MSPQYVCRLERHSIGLVAIFIIIIFLLLPSNISTSQAQISKGKVFVMYAASLIKTFEEIFGPAFQKETGYIYDGEPRGSVQIVNMITDGLRRPDFFVSAGSIPIEMLMNNTTPSANWLVRFGSAEVVIAYSPQSRFFGDLEKARTGGIPWYEILSRHDFKFGRTSPEFDPKGYYTIITAELANLYYNDSGIKQRILGDDNNPKQIFPEEILKTILEQGQLDAVAAYKHEAVARGLPYIKLPLQINLAEPAYIDFYKRSSYTLKNSGHTVYGEPIYFSFTIPSTVTNIDGAVAFGNYILSSSAKDILNDQGLNPIKPQIEGDAAKVPSTIRNIIANS